MCREDDLAISSGLLAPLHDFQDDRRCQLVVEVIQMTDIRLKVIQNLAKLHPCFLAVNRLDRISQFAQLASTVEIHITCISIYPIANTASFMFHTKILNHMSHFFQMLTQFKYVGFTPSIWI